MHNLYCQMMEKGNVGQTTGTLIIKLQHNVSPVVLEEKKKGKKTSVSETGHLCTSIVRF